MALSESSPFSQSESPTSLKLSEASKNLDSRGISYGEYLPRNTLNAIPKITPIGIKEVLKYLEQNGNPNTLSEALSKIDDMIAQHMKYDAINYLLGDIVDTRTESFIATIDPSKIWISDTQLQALRQRIPKIKKYLQELQTKHHETEALPNLDSSTKDLEGIKTLLAWPYGIDIAEFLSQDQEYIQVHHKTFETSVAKLLKNKIGQCHTFAALGKTILESGNGKWWLGIRNITYLGSPSWDHTVLEVTLRNGEKVVWDGTRGMVVKK